MELIIKTNNAEQDRYVSALIKSLKELGITVKKSNMKSIAKKTKNGAAAVALFSKIASNGGITSIPDPMKWQKEIRKDRKLPR